MERKEIHEKIAEITELININNNRLFLHDDKIAQLEIDVLRKNTIELYEQINLLHITNLKSKSPVKLTSMDSDLIAIKDEIQEVVAPVKEVPKYDLPDFTKKPEPVIEKVIEVKKEEAKPIVEAPKIEIIPEKSEPSVEKVVPVETTKIPEKPEAKLEAKAETPLPPPAPKEQQKDLFEIKTSPVENTVKSKSTNDLQQIFEKYRTSKIDNIKKAISILKRYEYQNQLFANDPKAYTLAIDMLDQAANVEVAISLLENSWPSQYKWDEKSETLVEELKELVYRRFS